MIPDYFDQALGYLFLSEGMKYTCDPKDRGQSTKMGITITTLSEWLGHAASPEDVEKLDAVDAAAIYKELFWDKFKLNEVEQRAMALALFDQIVNCKHDAIKMAQAVCRDHTSPDLVVDGHMGPKTITALNSIDQTFFIDRFVERVINRYKQICEKDIVQTRFLKGWLVRAERLKTLYADGDGGSV